MSARLRRIAADYEEIKKNFSGHKNISVEPIGPEPAEKYKVTYYINGIYLKEDNTVETLNKHIVMITLHSEYPRYKPICTIETPIWHPNFKDGQICIGDIWGAGESISDIIVNIGDMIQYKSWNSFSPLSAAAAKWAIENKHMLPVGNIDLWTGEEESGDVVSNFDIDIFEDDYKEVEESIASTKESIDEEYIDEDSNEKNIDKENTETEYDSNMNNEVLEDEAENDFDITAEELEGITFVPSTVKMQSIQDENISKSKKVNFKTIFFKGILYGLIGGVIGWMLQELLSIDAEKILMWKGHPYSSFSTDIYLGKITEDQAYLLISNAIRLESSFFSGIIGGVIGCVMGIGEGIYYGSKRNAVKYGLIGLGITFAISFMGGFLAQTLYGILLADTNEYTSEIYLAFGRGISWSVMGLGVGVSIGLIKAEKLRIINCLLGGTMGGFIGGFLFDFIASSVSTSEMDTGIVPRAIGIIIMGALIGLGIGLLEQFAKSAWLKVVRGEFEGKEYLVFKGITSIGNSGKNTIVLFKDKLVSPKHCDIIQEGNKYVLIDKGSPAGTFVNGIKITKHALKQGDTISLGNSVLVFNTK